jgi:hypothetical protein
MPERVLLAVALLVLVNGLAIVAIIDATEPGHTLDAVSVGTIGAVVATLSAAAIGVVVGNKLLGTQRDTREEEPPEE